MRSAVCTLTYTHAHTCARQVHHHIVTTTIAFLPSNTAYNNAFLPSRSLSEHARATEFPSFADYRFIIHSIKQMEQPPSDIVDVLRPAQLQEYRELFACIDGDGSGVVSMDELETWFGDMGVTHEETSAEPSGGAGG